MMTGSTRANLLAVAIVGSVDSQPPGGMVEASMTDAHGREWRFIENASVFTTDLIGHAAGRTGAGAIRCRVVDGNTADGVVTIDTAAIDGVESIEGATRFEVTAAQVLEAEMAPTSE